jgi:hypothetical protein
LISSVTVPVYEAGSCRRGNISAALKLVKIRHISGNEADSITPFRKAGT